MTRALTVFFLIFFSSVFSSASILVPMDDSQANHLKAYGLAYRALQSGIQVKWLLNYRGGSFLVLSDAQTLADWALTRNITTEPADANRAAAIQSQIDQENMQTVVLTSAPRIAVYAPPWNAPWDDAVTMALKYSEIPYTVIWDEEVLGGALKNNQYDWLHLHHEDFTGQHGKFWFGYSHEKWYIERSVLFESIARKLGYKSVQEEKKAVALSIREFVLNGGFLFAMCAATETLDIGLSSIGLDIIPPEIDGTPLDMEVNSRLDYSNAFSFAGFRLVTDPYVYKFSDINIDPLQEGVYYNPFYIKLNDFSAKYDTIPSMLVQNHRNLVKGFLGQTTAFSLNVIKKDVTILDTVEGKNWTTYIHGDRGKGTFTFFGGHDPEDYAHKVGDPPTNLDLFPNSPGYRIILNNILFPAAKEKKKKT